MNFVEEFLDQIKKNPRSSSVIEQRGIFHLDQISGAYMMTPEGVKINLMASTNFALLEEDCFRLDGAQIVAEIVAIDSMEVDDQIENVAVINNLKSLH